MYGPCGFVLVEATGAAAGGHLGVATGAWQGRAMSANGCPLVASGFEAVDPICVAACALTVSLVAVLGDPVLFAVVSTCCCASLCGVPPRWRLANLTLGRGVGRYLQFAGIPARSCGCLLGLAGACHVRECMRMVSTAAAA